MTAAAQLKAVPVDSFERTHRSQRSESMPVLL
jgi:hypothetical protein